MSLFQRMIHFTKKLFLKESSDTIAAVLDDGQLSTVPPSIIQSAKDDQLLQDISDQWSLIDTDDPLFNHSGSVDYDTLMDHPRLCRTHTPSVSRQVIDSPPLSSPTGLPSTNF